MNSNRKIGVLLLAFAASYAVYTGNLPFPKLPGWISVPVVNVDPPIAKEGYHVLVVCPPDQITPPVAGLINSVRIVRYIQDELGGVYKWVSPIDPPQDPAYAAAIGQGWELPMVIISNSKKGGEVLPVAQFASREGVDIDAFKEVLNKWN